MNLASRLALFGLGYSVVCGAALRAAPSEPTVVTYPAPAEITPAADYRVEVGGRPVFVYNTAWGAIASFSFEGEVAVRVTPRNDPKWVDLRPLSLGLVPAIRGGAIEFKLSKPCQLSLELNRDVRRPLFLFANPLETNVPTAATPKVRYFEGGKVHQAGVIELASDETVYIAGGAVVRGLIKAQNARNLRILGRGILDGAQNREFPGARGTRFLQFRDCEGISIEGITLINSPTWQIVPINCQNVAIRNVKIVCGNNSDDGIDLVRSRNVVIERSFVRTKDDCIAVKTTYDYPAEVGTENVRVTDSVFWNAEWGNALEIGFELRGPVRNILMKNCDIIHVDGGAALSIHNGDSATVSDIRFEDIRIEDANQKLVDLAIFLSRYSVDRPTDAAQLQRRYLPGAWDGVLSVGPDEQAKHAPYRGQIRDIVFKDIRVVDGPHPFSILYGFDDQHPVRNVVFENLEIHGRKIKSAAEGKMTLERAQGVVFK